MQEVAGPVSAGARLDDAITSLPGVGPRTAERLRVRGLGTIAELMFYLPRDYDDLRQVTPIAALAAAPAGQVVLVRGVVKRVRIFPRRLLDVYLEDEGGAVVRARWFRPPSGMHKSFARGARVGVAGPVRRIDDGTGDAGARASGTGGGAGAGVEIVQPAVHKDGEGGLGIRARYSVVPGVSARVLEKIIAAAADRYADLVAEALPVELRQRLGLPAVADTLREIHGRAPSTTSAEALGALVRGRSPAHRRLAFEDLLMVQLGLFAGRRQARAQGARSCEGAVAPALAALQAALPFALTGAQRRAVDEIARDLATPRPMQRLLVGDVGSGKTVVAFAAAAIAAAAGGQTILMAPTEVLVEQHLRTLAALSAGTLAGRGPAGPWPLAAARFTASMTREERAATLARCRSGEIQLLVGTQALLESPPLFADLRLAIVDEQHRFGVAQRARLRRADGPFSAASDGDAGRRLLPHLLVMSATPIPRTLALTLYGDLDASFLREGPPGRQPIETEIFAGADRRAAAYQRLEAAVAEGRQAYVVCPVRAHAARAGAVTAVARAAELRRQLGPGGVRVGLLHGALDADEKEARLRAFAAGRIDVLVATTVIELGIDVANAAVMLVEEADRFGLAQLHQLRGRVGRGPFGGACLLCTAEPLAPGSDAQRRLEQLAATSDGFRIAEADLALRGHGDLFGVRQSGAPRLRLGGLADYVDLLELARAEAEGIAAVDPALARPEHRGLRDAVLARWSAGAVFGEETG